VICVGALLALSIGQAAERNDITLTADAANKQVQVQNSGSSQDIDVLLTVVLGQYELADPNCTDDATQVRDVRLEDIPFGTTRTRTLSQLGFDLDADCEAYIITGLSEVLDTLEVDIDHDVKDTGDDLDVEDCTSGTLLTNIEGDLDFSNDIDLTAIGSGMSCVGLPERHIQVRNTNYSTREYEAGTLAKYRCGDYGQNDYCSTELPATPAGDAWVEGAGGSLLDTSTPCMVLQLAAAGLPLCCDTADTAEQCARFAVTQVEDSGGATACGPAYVSALAYDADADSDDPDDARISLVGRCSFEPLFDPNTFTSTTCYGTDSDSDGSIVDCDCDDSETTYFRLPYEIRTAGIFDPNRPNAISWELEDINAGSGAFYDVIRGNLETDLGTGGDTFNCQEQGSTDNETVHSTAPDTDEGFFYWIRARDDCDPGEGTYGENSTGTERTPTECDPE
jgi:hypothetical protein